MTPANATTQQRGSTATNRFTLLKFLIIVVPMWVSAKFYGGPYMEFIRNYLAAIILIVLLGLIVQMILVRAPEKGILVALFLLLSALQIVLHFVPGLFEGLRFSVGQGEFFGGNASIHLIPYYGVGAFIGYFVLKQGRKD